jgi:hypothetical protein
MIMENETGDCNKNKTEVKEDFSSQWNEVEAAVARSMELFVETLAGLKEQGRVKETKKAIIVTGFLAVYHLHKDELFDQLTNPLRVFYPGMPYVRILRLTGLQADPLKCCIQSRSPFPCGDSLTSLLLSLVDDANTFHKPGLSTMREGLLNLYGFALSPISSHFQRWLEETKRGTLNHETMTAEFQGTDGFEFRVQENSGEYIVSFKRRRAKNWHLIPSEAVKLLEGYGKFPYGIIEFLRVQPGEWFSYPQMAIFESDYPAARIIAERFAPLRRAMEDYQQLEEE